MAVTYGFFNSVNGDRKYNAEQMSEYFRGIINEGVYQHLDGGLAVTAGTGLAVNVAAGRAIIQNRWVQNSAAMSLTIAAASETYARKDAVVIRLNWSSRSISIAVKTGTPAASPVAPSMTRNSTTYEMALAYVNVAANATSVTVTDKRSDSTVCGWVTVAQSTSGEVDAQLNAMKTGFDGVEYGSPAAMVQGEDQKLQTNITTEKNERETIAGKIATPLFSDTLTIGGTSFYATGVDVQANHKYALICTDVYNKEIGLRTSAGTWAVVSAVGKLYTTITFGETVPSHNSYGLYIIAYGTQLSGDFYIFDVTNDSALESYLQGDFISDTVKWYGGEIKPRLETVENAINLEVDTQYKSTTLIYSVGGTYSFSNPKLTGTFNGSTDSRVSILSDLTANNKYVVKAVLTNANETDVIWRFALLKTDYSWYSSNIANYGVAAGNTRTVTLEITPTANCWLTVINRQGSNIAIDMDVYLYNLGGFSEKQQDIVKAYGYENLGATNTINYSIYSYRSLESAVSDNSKSVYGKWYDKKIWFCGDSITEYNYYPPKVASLLGLNSYYTDGHAGSAISGCVASIISTPSSLTGYDVLTVFAGTNDFGGNKDLGTIESTAGTDTTYGSLKQIISVIQTALPNLRIVFITPLPRGKFDTQPDYGAANPRGKYLSDYVQAVKDVGELYHIPVIDLYDTIGWNEYNISTKTIDNLHPTQTASVNELAPLIAEALKSL